MQQAVQEGLSRPREVKGKTDDELFSAEQAAAFQAVDRQVLETGLLMKSKTCSLRRWTHKQDRPEVSVVQRRRRNLRHRRAVTARLKESERRVSCS